MSNFFTQIIKINKKIVILFLVIFFLNFFFSFILFYKYYLTPRYEYLQALQFRPFQIGYERLIDLPVRKFLAAGDETRWDTEVDSSYQYENYTIDLDKTALIIIDAWEYHGNDGWLKRVQENQRTKLSTLLELARKHEITVIHAPHNEEVARELKPLPNELVLSYFNLLQNTEEFDTYLKKYDINTLLYAGYALNWCVLTRPVGMINMNNLGYDTILVRDATIAFETPDSLPNEWAYAITVNMVESQWGGTTTVDELAQVLDVLDSDAVSTKP